MPNNLFHLIFTSSASSPPGIKVPSLEQKQYGNSQFPGSHLFARSTGGSVIGAGAVKKKTLKMKILTLCFCLTYLREWGRIWLRFWRCKICLCRQNRGRKDTCWHKDIHRHIDKIACKLLDRRSFHFQLPEGTEILLLFFLLWAPACRFDFGTELSKTQKYKFISFYYLIKNNEEVRFILQQEYNSDTTIFDFDVIDSVTSISIISFLCFYVDLIMFASYTNISKKLVILCFYCLYCCYIFEIRISAKIEF